MSKSRGRTTRRGGRPSIPAVGIAGLRRRPTHPGEIFREEFRAVQDPPISQAEAARRLGWSTNRMNEFEVGKRGVTAENAIMLGQLTGTSPEFWMRLQMDYDLWGALQKVRHVKRLLPGEPFPSRHRSPAHSPGGER